MTGFAFFYMKPFLTFENVFEKAAGFPISINGKV